VLSLVFLGTPNMFERSIAFLPCSCREAAEGERAMS